MTLKKITIRTTENKQIIDITDKIEEVIDVKEGLCVVWAPHATAGIIVNEWEPRIAGDYLRFFEKLAPKTNYEHNSIDDNAEAHLLSALIGSGKTVPVSNGKLALGTWQRILFCELDGPRTERKVYLQVIGK